MKHVAIAIVVIVIAVVLSGCFCGPSYNKKIVREYNHSAADNVTINFYSQTVPTILKTNNSEIKIEESFEIKESMWLSSRDNSYVSYLSDFVSFIGDDKNMSVNIAMINLVGEYRADNVNLTVYLPEYSNFTLLATHDININNSESAPYVTKINP